MPLNLELLPDKPKISPQKFTLDLSLLPDKPKAKEDYAKTATRFVEEMVKPLKGQIPFPKETAETALKGAEAGLKIIRWPFWRAIEHPISAIGTDIQKRQFGLETVKRAGESLIPFRRVREPKFYEDIWSNYWKSITGTEAPEWYKAMASFGTAVGVEPAAIRGYKELGYKSLTRPSTKEEADYIVKVFKPLKDYLLKRGLDVKKLHPKGNIIQLDENTKIGINRGVTAVLRGDKIRLPRWMKLKREFLPEILAKETPELTAISASQLPAVIKPSPTALPEVGIPKILEPATAPILKPEVKLKVKPLQTPKEIPAKKTLKILPKKEQLLIQIDEAIKKAPTEKNLFEQYGVKDAEGIIDIQASYIKMPKVSFETDGGANIINSKESLTRFYDIIKKQPATIQTLKQPPKLSIESVSAKKERIDELVPIKKKGFFTDSKLLIKGTPPAGVKMREGEEMPVERIDEILNTPTKPANFMYYATKTLDVEGVSPKPIPQTDKDYTPRAIFVSEGKYYQYDQFKYNAITKRFPKANYGIGENGQLVAYINKEPVAVLMPMRTWEEGVFEKEAPLREEAEKAGLIKTIKPVPKGEAFALPEGELPPEVPVPPKEELVPEEHESRIEMPELVKLAKELSGDFPTLMKLRRSLGYFKHIGAKGRIKLHPKIFKNVFLAQKVLAHEIGHLVDWLPDYTLARGNILGRLASLRKYLSDMISELPDENELLTPKERFKLHLQVAREGKELSKEQIKEIYQQRLREVAKSRGLITRSEVMAELKKLTQYWNAFDETVDPSYTAYRYNPKELYAEALSVLINKPEKLEEIAPIFYKTFWNYIDRKPEAKQKLLELEEFLNLKPEEKARIRRKDIRSGFKKAEEIFLEKRAQKALRSHNVFLHIKSEILDKNYPIIEKVLEAQKQGKIINPDDNPRYYLEAWNYVGGKIKNDLDDMNTKVAIPLEEADLTLEDFGEMAFLLRVAYERKEIANPFGFEPKTAKAQAEDLMKILGEKKTEALLRAYQNFQLQITDILKEALQAGLINPETYAEISTNPVYATFQVLDYIDEYITPSIIQQVGTLKPITNPFVATTLKMISLRRAIERNITNKSVVDFLKSNFPEEIQPAKIRHFGKYKAEIVEKEGFGIIKVREEGKLKGYYVSPEIAKSLKNSPIGYTRGILGLLKFANSRYFRPVFISWNLGFQAFNLLRDMWRAWQNTPELPFWSIFSRYMNALPHAKKRVLGISDELIKEMQERGMLSFTYNDIIKGEWGKSINELESEYDYLLRKYDIVEKAKLNPLMKLLDYIEKLGDIIETLPKVAGYKARLKNPKLHWREIAHEVRVYTGSPDFLTKGEFYDITNNIALFSNAITQGFRGDFEVMFKNPRTRATFWWRTTESVLIPKLLMALAMAGFFGKAIADNYKKQTEYDKTNYLTIPLGLTENGKAVYIRLPFSEMGRLLGGIFWKFLTFKGREETPFEAMQNVASFTGGQLPSMSPALEIVSSWMQYAMGKNPYDWFRGDNVLSDDEAKAGGWYAFKEMAQWTAGKMGAYSFTIKTRRGDKKTPFEQILNYSPVLNRFIRVTSYGEEEARRKLKQKRERRKAIRRVKKWKRKFR